MQAGIATQSAVEKLVRFRRIEMHAAKQKATAAQAKRFLRIASRKGFIAHVRNHSGERLSFGWIIVKNARSERHAGSCHFDGLVSCVCHDGARGNKCAK